MKYLRSVRGRLLCIAFIPAAALVLVALVIAIFLLRQAIQTRDLAWEAADAVERTTRAVVALQLQRNAAMAKPDDRAAAYVNFTRRIDDAIADLRAYARRAPDAECGFQQTTAVELLSVAEGMYRSDSLAVAGLDPLTRPQFASAVAAYRAELTRVSGQLTDSGRTAYETLVRGSDWSTLATAEAALAAARPLPFPETRWRTAAYDVSVQLGGLYAQQSQHAVQHALDEGRRTLAGALAAAGAIVLVAVLVLVVVRRLIARVPMPVVPIMVPTVRPAIPRPRHAALRRRRAAEPWPANAVIDDPRRS